MSAESKSRDSAAASAQNASRRADEGHQLRNDDAIATQDQPGEAAAAKRDTHWEIVFSACLVVFAFGQCLVGFWQWGTTHDQYRAMLSQLDYMMQDQRPWIGFEPPTLNAPLPGKSIAGTGVMKNSGRSPATIVERHLDHIFAKNGSKDGAPSRLASNYDLNIGRTFAEILGDFRRAHVDWQEETVIPPSTSDVIDYESPPLSLDEKTVNELNDGSTILVLINYVRYLDISQKEHTTWACFIYHPSLGRCIRYPKYNRMD